MLLFSRISGKFDYVQLKALKEFLPTEEEESGLKQYITSNSKSEEAKDAAMKELCACEKYMVAMMEVPDAGLKFDCLLFEDQFDGRMEHSIESISTLQKTCDDVKNSDRLRKLMAMILTVGNYINTGGSGNLAAGFSLDALLKLDEVCMGECSRLYSKAPSRLNLTKFNYEISHFLSFSGKSI